MSKQPRAFRMENEAGERRPVDKVTVEYEPDDAIDAALPAAVAQPPGRGGNWFLVFAGAVLVFVLMGLGRSAYLLIADFMADSVWLGGIAVAVAFAGIVAALVLLTREAIGVLGERRIERIRRDAADALAVGNEKGAVEVAGRVVRLYRDDGGRALSRLETLNGAIMAAEDRLVFIEREVLSPLDAEARRIVAAAARQVSLVTTLSPRAAIDVLFVAYASIRMLRRLSRLYGGRPGFWGFLRLLRGAFAHLALTGGIAVGDSLLQQVFGLGVAAKVSARLGEGVLNGMMTARFGLAAISVCRPLPFIGLPPPRLGEVAGELMKKSRSDEDAAG